MGNIWLARFITAVVLLFFFPATTAGMLSAQDLSLDTDHDHYRFQAIQREGQDYYRLDSIASSMGCEVKYREATAKVSGPAGTLILTAGRSLVRSGDEYVLLSAPPWQNTGGVWYVAEDFLARALVLVLDQKLDRIADRHYRLGTVPREVRLEVTNRLDHVRVTIRPQQPMPFSFLELSDRIEVGLGAIDVAVAFPNTKPNRGIVTSISQEADALVIRKGPRYDYCVDTQNQTGNELILDLFGVPSTIVQLPSSSEPSVSEDDSEGVFSDQDVEAVSPSAPAVLQHPRGSTVVIDPGHGGNDQGVVWGEVMEKDLALVLAFEIQQILESNGYSCRLTRSRDLNLPMEQRSGVANYYHPRVFLSLHIGGSPSSSTRSSTIYVHDQIRTSSTNLNGNPGDGLVPWAEAQGPHRSESGKLAEQIRLGLKSLGEEPSPTVGVPITVLSSVAAPAVLIEVGYLTNPSQRENLLHQAFRTQIAEAIARGVSDYLRNSVAPE